jgi:hypothetical protein
VDKETSIMKGVVRYNYSWGDEDVPSSTIIVTQTGKEQYEILFEQEGSVGSMKDFRNIRTTAYLDSSDILERTRHDKGVDQKRVRLDVIAKCNPRPEELFEIIK